MSKALLFLLGAGVGALAGVLISPHLVRGATPPVVVTDPPASIEAPSAHIGPRLRSSAPPSETATPRAELGSDARRAAAEAMGAPENAPGERVVLWRSRARAAVDWDPASAIHRAWFAEARVDLAGGDRAVAEAAGYALAWAGMQGRLSAAQLDDLGGLLPGLLSRYDADTPSFRRHFYGSLELDPPIEETDPAAWTAWIRAEGWKKDPAKLDALIRGVPAHQDPSVHLALLLAMRGRSDDLHRGYVTRLTQASPHPEVLQQAWDRKRMSSIGNPAWIPGQLEALGTRLFRGDLESHTRARGWQAVAQLALRDSPRGTRLLREAANGAEVDAGNRAFCHAAFELMTHGLGDDTALQELAVRHPPGDR